MKTPQPQRDREYVEAAAHKFREGLTALVAEYRRRGVEPRKVLGAPVDLGTRAVRATAPVPTPWDKLVGPFTRSEGVQARLGITRQAIAGKARRRRLLRVISADGKHLYPLWQFRGNRVLPGLPEVLAMFPEDAVDGWMLAGWLRTLEPELGESPLDALMRGEGAEVRVVARLAARSLVP